VPAKLSWLLKQGRQHSLLLLVRFKLALALDCLRQNPL
jgi:hypothetical protein